MNEINDYEFQFQETKNSSPDHIFWESPTRKIFRFHDIVIKFGSGVDAREAETLQFIKNATQIPVPAATNDGPNVVVMEYVEGMNLEKCWPQVSSEEKQRIAEQMHNIIQQLRGLKGDYIGAVNRGPVVDMRRSISRGGPFNSEAAFNNFLVGKMISTSPLLHRQALQQTMRIDHSIVFSHGDLNLHNIIVKDGNIVGLLDWECAGWYPEYWEYIKFCHASLYDPTWHKCGLTIFPKTYPDELIKDQYYGLFVF